MDSIYLVIDYNDAKSIDPQVALKTTDIWAARQMFEQLLQTNEDASVLLYECTKDNILNVAIQSEPIFLVNAIEFARKHIVFQGSLKHNYKIARTDVSDFIKYISRRIAGGPPEDVFNKAITVAPYYVNRGDVPGKEVKISETHSKFYKMFTHPRKCGYCRGTGLVDNLYRCPVCDGYGYTKKN
ncbi:Hypothetical predicted protein [Mytilus galloprovincialis]|uniref:Uncharacterized protein n=1 Tax=Mytilus galloprovincialis TaxID=29158 RepID=A0A8B6GGX5_MYTGA|nr:Hypothetical predicted protein [Mytilus galloprovincialis]